MVCALIESKKKAISLIDFLGFTSRVEAFVLGHMHTTLVDVLFSFACSTVTPRVRRHALWLPAALPCHVSRHVLVSTYPPPVSPVSPRFRRGLFDPCGIRLELRLPFFWGEVDKSRVPLFFLFILFSSFSERVLCSAPRGAAVAGPLAADAAAALRAAAGHHAAAAGAPNEDRDTTCTTTCTRERREGEGEEEKRRL